MNIRLGLALVAALLTGCTDGFVTFPVSKNGQEALPDTVEVIQLTDQNVGSFASPARGHAATGMPKGRDWDYRVGVGDFLNVTVFNHPELLMPISPDALSNAASAGAAGLPAADAGFRVQSNGTFYFPFIGEVQAAGLLPEEIRKTMIERLSQYIPDPQVAVEVKNFNSQGVLVSGEVVRPSRLPLTTTALTLVEAITSSGGAKPNADLRQVSVQRGKNRYTVDVSGFFEAGVTSNNPLLINGDVVNVPLRTPEEAYLLGQITKPSIVDLSLGEVSLTQAVSRQGGLDEKRGDARGIFVFRNRIPGKTTVFQLDVKNPTGLLLGTRFVLEPSDVVYVVRSPLARWNDVISSLLPSVQAATAAKSL